VGPTYGHLVYFTAIWYIFSRFWYVAQRKIWQPWLQEQSVFEIRHGQFLQQVNATLTLPFSDNNNNNLIQGEQIGRIFANWVRVHFLVIFYNYIISQNF
jgi:hypothetical protein